MILAWLAGLALAQPVTLNDVLSAVDPRVPQLAAAAAKLQQAEGKLLASQGAFDPRLVGKLKHTLNKDERTQLDSALQIPTALGPTVEGGWRRGVGDYPTYEVDGPTAEPGEIRFGVDVPLLAGLGTNPAEAGVRDARWSVEGAEATLADKRVQVLRKAEEAWWKWVASGAKLEVAEQQVQLADQRAGALQVEVAQGSRSRLQQLDNERVLYERQAQRVHAEQELQIAAQILSLWYRDPQGRPIVPSSDDVPPLPVPTPSERDVAADVAVALDRPEVQAVQASLERSRVAVGLGRNQVLPKLNGKVEARQDLVEEPTEWRLGAELAWPLVMRKGRGTLIAAQSAEAEVGEALRGLRDQISVEVTTAHTARDAAAEAIRWTGLASERASEVLELERRGWELGASDLFVLLQREERLAKARKEAIDAQLRFSLTDVALRAAIGAGGES